MGEDWEVEKGVGLEEVILVVGEEREVGKGVEGVAVGGPVGERVRGERTDCYQ